MERCRYKPKILISILLLFICMLFMMPLTVHAYNGGQGTGDQGAGGLGNGINTTRQGILIYVADKDTGEMQTGIIAVSRQPESAVSLFRGEGHGHNRQYRVKLYDKYTGNNRYGGISKWCQYAGTPLALPWRGNSWVPNGNEVKEWLCRQDSSKRYLYEKLIFDTFGGEYPDIIKDMHENADTWVVCVEYFHWNPIWKDGSYTKWWGLGTISGWALINDQYSGPRGDPKTTGNYTNKAAPFAMVLEGEFFGFTPHNGESMRYLTNDEMRVNDYGLHVIPLESSSIRTYWEPNGSPGDPEPNNPPKDGLCNIVKGYYEENETTGVKTSLGVYWEKDVTNNIVICDEPEFQLVRWDIGSKFNKDLDPTNWNPPSSLRNGTTPQSVTLKNPEKTVYVLLKKVINEAPDLGEVNYNLSQSTITRRVDFSKSDSDTGMAKIHEKEFTWSIAAHQTTCTHTWTTQDPCPGNHTRTHQHSTDCPEGCSQTETYNCGGNCVTTNHSASCTWGTWEDNALMFSLTNKKAKEAGYTKILGTKETQYRQEVIEKGNVAGIKRLVGKTRDNTAAQEYTISNWDYRCVLWRGNDQLIVAKWKNEDLGTQANSDLEKISSVDNTGFRVTDNDTAQRKTTNYKEQFSAEINCDSPDKNTTYKATTGANVNGTVITPCSTTRTASLKEKLDIDVKVKLDVYSGSQTGGYNDTYCASGRQNHSVSGYNKHNGVEVPSGGVISFKPYIKMNYSTYDKKEPMTAYVLGEHVRSMTPNDYAEICWNEQGSPNLKLTSLQWSSHKMAVDKWGAGNVLPGGAALSLSIPDSARQKILLTTYQVILEGTGKTQVEKTGGDVGSFTMSNAVAAHQAYVDSVVKGFDSLNVEQWVNINTDNPAWSGNGRAVNYGDDISFIGTSGLHASDDMKYYFSNDGEQGGDGAGEGDLDVEDLGVQSTDTYTFFTNTDGEVRYIKNNINPNKGSETMGSLASDSTANFINVRTHVVDKLAAAVERNTGKDKAYGDEGIRSGKEAWYSEAFDGVTVIVQKTELSVGYKAPNARTNLLDPRLCKPNEKGQSGMFKDGSYSSSQYKCRDHNEAYIAKDKVGVFKNTDIFTEKMDMFFWSRPFYIPNMNVQDLH